MNENDGRQQTREEVRRFVAGGDTDKPIKFARWFAEALEKPGVARELEQAGAERELTVEGMITALGRELREGSDAERAEARLVLERLEEIKHSQQASGGTPQRRDSGS